jgi:hypothetical protein
MIIIQLADMDNDIKLDLIDSFKFVIDRKKFLKYCYIGIRDDSYTFQLMLDRKDHSIKSVKNEKSLKNCFTSEIIYNKFRTQLEELLLKLI